MTIPFIWKRKILDRGKSVSEDHSLDRQELVPVVRMVTSLSAYLYIFLIAFYLPPWNSFLKSHWNRDESQVKGLTLFSSALFSVDISETIKSQHSRTMKETGNFPSTDGYRKEHIGVVAVKQPCMERNST